MKGLSAALWVEILKVRKSKMFVGTIVFFSFVAIMMGMLMFLSQHPEIAGRSATMGAKASMVGNGDWPSFFNLLVQVILSMGTIGFGLVASWLFGREYSDRVVKDILVLPVSRPVIVVAKLVVTGLWCLLLSIVFLVVALWTGWLVQLPAWSSDVYITGIISYMQAAIFTIMLCTVVAFVASVGRGYLLPIAFVILSLIITQLVFVGMPGMTIYFPWAFPALCSGVAGDAVTGPETISLLFFGLTVIAGFSGTIVWWKYADQK